MRIRRVPWGMGGVPGGNGPAAGEGWPGGGSSFAGDVLHGLHAGLPQGVGRLRIALVHAALIDARQYVGLARHDAGADLHLADRREAAEPLLVADFHRLAVADQADADVAFEIGDHVGALVRASRRMVDPEHRFLADRCVVALHQPAIAPHQPDFELAFLPAVGRHGRDHDRIGVIPLRQANLRKQRCRQQEACGHHKNPKRKQGPGVGSPQRKQGPGSPHGKQDPGVGNPQRKQGPGSPQAQARSREQTKLACASGFDRAVRVARAYRERGRRAGPRRGWSAPIFRLVVSAD